MSTSSAACARAAWPAAPLRARGRHSDRDLAGAVELSRESQALAQTRRRTVEIVSKQSKHTPAELQVAQAVQIADVLHDCGASLPALPERAQGLPAPAQRVPGHRAQSACAQLSPSARPPE